MNRYFSVDTEFSGLDFTKDCIVSVGIVEVAHGDNGFSVLLKHQFYSEVKPITDHFNKESMKINGFDFNNLQKSAPDSLDVCIGINQYLNLQPDDNAIFVAYCGVLDKIFLDAIFTYNDMESPFNYEIIEISSLAIGKLGFEWGFSEQDLETKINLPPTNKAKKHNALGDAVHQAQEFAAVMNYKPNKIKHLLKSHKDLS